MKCACACITSFTLAMYSHCHYFIAIPKRMYRHINNNTWSFQFECILFALNYFNAIKKYVDLTFMASFCGGGGGGAFDAFGTNINRHRYRHTTKFLLHTHKSHWEWWRKACICFKYYTKSMVTVMACALANFSIQWQRFRFVAFSPCVISKFIAS